MYGKIKSIRGSFGSGLVFLTLEDASGNLSTVHGDSGPTCRALDACFGCIVPGHQIDNRILENVEIEYEVDDLGILTVFSPL